MIAAQCSDFRQRGERGRGVDQVSSGEVGINNGETVRKAIIVDERAAELKKSASARLVKVTHRPVGVTQAQLRTRSS